MVQGNMECFSIATQLTGQVKMSEGLKYL
jgi:hypothetical protein